MIYNYVMTSGDLRVSYTCFLQETCAYVVYDFHYKLLDGSDRAKLVFITWFVMNFCCMQIRALRD